jgi:hypothetical protein
MQSVPSRRIILDDEEDFIPDECIPQGDAEESGQGVEAKEEGKEEKNQGENEEVAQEEELEEAKETRERCDWVEDEAVEDDVGEEEENKDDEEEEEEPYGEDLDGESVSGEAIEGGDEYEMDGFVVPDEDEGEDSDHDDAEDEVAEPGKTGTKDKKARKKVETEPAEEKKEDQAPSAVAEEEVEKARVEGEEKETEDAKDVQVIRVADSEPRVEEIETPKGRGKITMIDLTTEPVRLFLSISISPVLHLLSCLFRWARRGVPCSSLFQRLRVLLFQRYGTGFEYDKCLTDL